MRTHLDMQPSELNSAPLIIGATGGSGTRAIAQLLIGSGHVYLGKNHNRALDCLDFKSFYDRHIPDFLPLFYSQELLSNATEFGQSMMRIDFKQSLNHYQEDALGSGSNWANAVWGWKGPRSLFLLPFWHAVFPDLRFLHVVRDGRDMAYSTNQNQLLLYGELSLAEKSGSQAERSIALWERANITASKYANKHMARQYHCIKYEDLVFETDNTLIDLADFLDIDANNLLRHKSRISPSPTYGRWKTQCQESVESVVNRGSRGLYYFGYR